MRYLLAIAAGLPLLFLADEMDRFSGIVLIVIAMALYASALLALRVVRLDELRRYASIASGLFTPAPRLDQ